MTTSGFFSVKAEMEPEVPFGISRDPRDLRVERISYIETGYLLDINIFHFLSLRRILVHFTASERVRKGEN